MSLYSELVFPWQPYFDRFFFFLMWNFLPLANKISLSGSYFYIFRTLEHGVMIFIILVTFLASNVPTFQGESS